MRLQFVERIKIELSHVLNAVLWLLQPVNALGLNPINRVIGLNAPSEPGEAGTTIQAVRNDYRSLLATSLQLHEGREPWKFGLIQ